MAMNLGTGNSDEPEVMMDINTTPLIDVMLVLIIMLIITIPAQLHAVNLAMPVTATAEKTQDTVPRRPDCNLNRSCTFARTPKPNTKLLPPYWSVRSVWA